MPRKLKPVGQESFVTIDGVTVPTESLTPEQWDECETKMLENIGRSMSDYYSAKLLEQS